MKPSIGVLAIIVLLAGLGSGAESADLGVSRQGQARMCKVRLEGYGEVERAAWEAICVGKPANLTRMRDPTLNPAFLTDILFNKPYREALSYRGVQIVGARFAGKLDLKDAIIEQPLKIEESLFDVPPDFTFLKAARGVSFRGSAFKCPSGGAVSFRSANIGGHLDLGGTWFGCTLDMGHLRVEGALFLNKLVDGKSEHNADYANVVLSNSHVGEKVSLEGARVAGKLDMVRMQVGTDVVMREHGQFGTVSLARGKIGGNLDLTTSTLKSLDLGGTRVEGEFTIGGGRWTKDATLSLGQAEVGAVSSPDPNAWPASLEIADFTYNRVGGFWGNARDDRELMVRQFENWLAKQPERQPYEQLGKALEREGYLDEASEILYAGREVGRSGAHSLIWLWLTLQDYFIGYGYKKWRALLWVAGFVVVGAVVFRWSEEAKRYRMPFGIAYSFDMLLPIVRLRDLHYDIDLKGWQRYYFYFHKIMGYVLASFVIAGLSGLSK